MTADFFAKKAAEHAAKCSDAENHRRRQNARCSNISFEFAEEDTAVLFRGTQTVGSESQSQQPAFGSAVFAHA